VTNPVRGRNTTLPVNNIVPGQTLIKTRLGKEWSANSVRLTLRKAAYIGRFVWGSRKTGKYHVVRNGEISTDVADDGDDGVLVIEDHHPPIVDQRIFDAAQKRLGEAQKATTPIRNGGNYLFTGLAKCGRCGVRMGGSDNHAPAYKCQRHRHYGTCDYNTVDQAELLDAVLGAIESRFNNPRTAQRLRGILSRKLRQRTKNVDVDDLRKQLAKIDTKLAKARRNMALADGDDLRRDYEAVVRELRQERERLETTIQNAQKPPQRTLADYDSRMSHRTSHWDAVTAA
jgi:hypothetical protein